MENLLLIIREIYSVYLQIAPFMLIGLFFVGLLHILFSKDFILKHVGAENVKSAINASILGVPLPLCSCGVIPTAVYMAKNGASRGAVVSFLISTPQTGIDSIIATYGMMGWIMAIYRPIVAFINGVIGGIIVNIFDSKHEKSLQVEETPQNCQGEGDSCCTPSQRTPSTFRNRVKTMYNYAFRDFIDDISWHFIVGVVMSGLIAFFIPEDFFVKYDLNSGILTMLLMVIVGIPMYVCATASIPIAITLILKGVSPGAAFVFLTLGPLTNIAALTILHKILGKKTLFLYLSVTSLSTISFALLLDFLLDLSNYNLSSILKKQHLHGQDISITFYVLSALFTLILIGSFLRKFVKKMGFLDSNNVIKENNLGETNMLLKVKGMSCNHCVDNVRKNLLKQNNVEIVDINLQTGEVLVTGRDLNRKEIKVLIDGLGYQVLE